MFVFSMCVLPVTCVSVMVYQAVHKGSEVAKEASSFFQDLKKDEDRKLQDQERQRQERKKEQQQWEEIARTWQAPPLGAPWQRLLPAVVGEHRRIEQDDQAQITDLNVSAPGWRAVYRGPLATVELFVYRAQKPDKEVLLRQAQQAITRRTAAAGLGPAHPNVWGSAEGMFLSYNLELSGTGAEQHGTFWGQQGWLFLARSGHPQAPGQFLKAYLTEISHK
jgi:hypothetical protein